MKLYSQSTQQILPSPRLDNEPIVGLSADYLVLTEVTATPPTYDPQTQSVIDNWTVDVDSLEYRQQWTVIDNPPIINWDGFNAYLLTDTMFKSYRDTVRAIDGELNAALFDGYGLVSTNGVGAFSLVWGAWVQLSGITTQDRNAIATVAESFNLPAEFVAVIFG